MKRFVILLLIPLFALSSRAEQKVTVGLLNYGLNSETKTATVVGCVVTGGNFSISIPSSVTYSGTTYNVKNIGNAAFSSCVGLTGITIPQTITSIGVSAFNGCSGLTSISIPRSVTTIGSYAFYNCTNLKDIYVYWTAFYAFQGFDFGSFIVSNYKNVNLHVPLGYESIYQQTEPWSLFYIAPTHILATSINLDRTSLTFTSKYESVQLHVTFNPKNVTNTTLTWTSSNTAVAIVNNGFVTAVGNGTATITARTTDGSNKSATCPVTVDISTAVLATSINLDRTSLTLTSAGQTATLNATISPSNATNKTVSWASSNPAVATVNNGVVTAVGNGTATITARTTDGSNKSATCSVTVNFPIKATGVTLNQTSLTLVSIGQTYTLHETVLPSNATNKRVSWKSSNPTVATVDGGLVRAVANGTTTVTVTTADGTSKTATCVVTVKTDTTLLATGVTLDQNSLTLNSTGQTASLTATVSPSYATDKSVTWTSSIPSVATVSSSGVVKAVANGTTTVTVTTADGSNKTATCVVTVTVPQIISMIGQPIKSISEINANSYYLLTSVGRHGSDGKYLCEVDNDPRFEIVTVGHSANAAFQFEIVDDIRFRIRTITGNYFPKSGGSSGWFATSMENPATFFIEPISGAEGQFTLQYTDAKRMYLDADSESISRWSIKSSANGNGAYRIVPVSLSDPVYARSVSINPTSLTLTSVGQTALLTAIVSPDNTSNKTLIWESSNTDVATVSSSGVVTAVASGTAVITATTVDGSNKIGACDVTVDLPVLATNVALNKTSLTLTSARDSAILIATVYPDNATDKTVTWTSSNTDVATVNSSGVVCAVDNGTAIITATTVDGSKKVATCFVTVGIKVNSIILNKNTMTLSNFNPADTLMVTVLPNNALNKAITWTSSNTDVATVNSDGIVVAKDKGTAIITAKTTDGSGLSATCVVTVTISPSEGKIISMIGNPIKNVSEINANSYYLLTSVGRHGSDGRYLCEVDNDPRFEIVTVGHSANAAFQFEIVDDTHFRIRTITGNYFPESGGSNGWFATSMENPATFFIEPISGAEGQFTLQYTDTGSMYLDANSASISRWSIKSSANGNGAYRIVPVTLTVQEDVPVLATGVTLNEHSLTLTNIGDTVTLIATVSPDSTTDKTVVWTSSNTKVATVNNNGVVTAVANGTATITVTTADGTNKTATCEVTVDDTSTGGIPGDVNGDGKVNGADVVAVINYVLAASTASEGDVNGDGKVNGADIVATINYVLSFTGTRAYEDNIPTETRRLETMFDYSNLFATTDANGISLAMEGGEDYTAFQFILTLPEKTRLKGVVADENRIGSHSLIYSEMADGRYLVLGYENGNRTIVGTSGTLLKLFVDNFESGMATISDVKFFTPQAETYKLRDVIIDLATGVGYISSDMTNGDVYDAHGRRVMTANDYEKRKQNLPAGFYIRNGRKFIVR